MRVRKKILGTSERPRLSVFKSTSHLYAQIIDDVSGKTLAACSTVEEKMSGAKNKEAAKKIGAELAKRAQAKKVSQVVFDRNGYRYHGKIKELADSAREAGLKF
ncbi:MAG: 50S ribosomal protein L18 [Oligoflexia bacterium]|nr:50S ribosomal protein L18 [Oligoflexia bacterium]